MKRNNRGALAYRETFWTGRLGIRGKILIYLLILAGFMLSLVWLSQSALLYNLYRRAALSQMSRTAGILVQNIDHEELTDLANQLGEENDLGILLIDASGETLLSAGQVRYTPFQEISREEALAWAQKASEEGKAHVETIPDEDKDRSAESLDRFAGDVSADSGGREERMVYVQQVAFSGGAKGTLLLTMRVTPVRSTRDTMRNQFILIMVAILLATAMVGYTMAGSISDPIIETNQAALELSRARYTRPPHSGGYREIAELNDTLVRTAEALSKVEDLQRELIANISHDLRTPLTMIEGYAEAMRDIPDEITPENMQIIIDETNRLSTMVNEVLDFSRLRTGSLELQKTEFNLTALARDICERISKMSAVEGYHVIFEPTEEAWVCADSGRISQVIYNLLGNALTYTGADQTVRVTQELRGSRVRVCISDSGEGIAQDELPYIWDRYYRSRENHRRAVIGSGLGLNICRGILENHHAEYGVSSRLGEGTTFWFELERISKASEA